MAIKANVKQARMESVQRLFQQGRTREQLSKQFKVSTSTIDDWRRRVTQGRGKNTVHAQNVERTATKKARTGTMNRLKSETALVALHNENVRLAAVVGKLFLALSDRQKGIAVHQVIL